MGEISHFARLALLSLLIWKQIQFFFQDIIRLPPTHPCGLREKAPLSPSPERHMNSTHSEPNQANPVTAGESGETIGKESTSLFYNLRC